MSLEIPMPKTADIALPEIAPLCERIVPRQKPLYLNIEQLEWAIINECYENVAKVIKQKGGGIQYGWQVWETLPSVMAEAEFHAVWRDADNNYHDVTPKGMPGITKILFLPDHSITYAGRQIDNIRIALRDDPLIHNFIQNAESYFEVTNRGELADYHGEIVATPEMERLMQQKTELLVAIVQKFY